MARFWHAHALLQYANACVMIIYYCLRHSVRKASTVSPKLFLDHSHPSTAAPAMGASRTPTNSSPPLPVHAAELLSRITPPDASRHFLPDGAPAGNAAVATSSAGGGTDGSMLEGLRSKSAEGSDYGGSDYGANGDGDGLLLHEGSVQIDSSPDALLGSGRFAEVRKGR